MRGCFRKFLHASKDLKCAEGSESEDAPKVLKRAEAFEISHMRQRFLNAPSWTPMGAAVSKDGLPQKTETANGQFWPSPLR